MPATVREQISVELSTFGTLIEMVNWTLGEIERFGSDGPRMIIDYADETSHWTTYQE